jgi:hypothetical protein
MGSDAHSMNIRLEQTANGIIDHLMALDPAQSGKRRGNNGDVEMAFPIPGTLMADVQLTLVLNQKFRRIE